MINNLSKEHMKRWKESRIKNANYFKIWCEVNLIKEMKLKEAIRLYNYREKND